MYGDSGRVNLNTGLAASVKDTIIHHGDRLVTCEKIIIDRTMIKGFMVV